MTLSARLACLLLAINGAAGIGAAEPDSWLGFRGDGSSEASSGPAQLANGDDGNLAWKLKMPGRSVASPIVVGDLVVTTGSGGQDGEQLFVSGVDLSSGELLWEQRFRATGRPFSHPSSANAAPSPVSDGKRIFAFFSSNDLACLSLDGELLWYRGLGYDYPQAGNDIGMASSPTIADGAVIVQVEAQGDSFAAGIDCETGQNLWRIDRPRQSNWTSPVVISRPDDSSEVVLQSGQDIVAVDPRSGNVKWRIEESRARTESPTPAGELLLLPGDDLLALNVGESASRPQTAWRNNQLSPRNASTAATGDRLYSLKGSVLVCAEIESGDVIWKQRLSGLGNTWATPVVAAGKIYVFDQSGTGLVIEDQGDSASTSSEVSLDDSVLASPAVASGRLVVRGTGTLYCFD